MQLAAFCVKKHQSESFLDSADRFASETSVVNDLPTTMKPRWRWERTRSRFYCRRSCLSCAWVSLCLDTKTGFSDFSACPRGSRVALTFQNPHRQARRILCTHVYEGLVLHGLGGTQHNGRNDEERSAELHMKEKCLKGTFSRRGLLLEGMCPGIVGARALASDRKDGMNFSCSVHRWAGFRYIRICKTPPLKVTSEQICHRASVQKTIHYRTNATGIH